MKNRIAIKDYAGAPLLAVTAKEHFILGKTQPKHRRSVLCRIDGIELTPDGKPLFARDYDRWVALGTADIRTESERAEDDAAEAS